MELAVTKESALPVEEDEQPITDAATSTEIVEKKSKKIKRVKKKRAARVQVDPATFKAPKAEASGTIFNIWYNKWSGGDRDVPVQFAAPGRCNVATDSGYTRADGTSGSFFCLQFARGICPRGRDCEYLHRLPELHDIFNPNVDCFGRDKFSDYRDDMGGVGSFMRQNRTLYIGRIHVTDDIEEIVARHFAEWGRVDRIRVLNMRGVAFVTYSNLANSEFAKEAMAHQSLDHDEVLNVRWATADPNPQAQKREARNIEEQAAEAIRKALPPDYVAQLEGRNGDSYKRRKIESSFGLEGYEAPDEIWYEKEKADWIAQTRGLAQADQDPHTEDQEILPEGSKHNIHQLEAQHDSQGIFSASTLASLNTRSVIAPSTKRTNAVKPSPGAPLVAYDSDASD